MCTKEEITLAVLAGGAGRRMGQPKGMLSILGKPILVYLFERFAWPGPTLLVTSPGREHPPGWERFKREVVDVVPDGGPLLGLHTALGNLETPMMVAATVDMPGIGTAQLAWLCDQMESRSDRLGILLERPGSAGKRIEPFPSIFLRSAMAIVEEQLKTGRGAVHALNQKQEILTLAAPADWGDSVWTNLNCAADLQTFVAGLQNSFQTVR